jgi:hypothetical protein
MSALTWKETLWHSSGVGKYKSKAVQLPSCRRQVGEEVFLDFIDGVSLHLWTSATNGHIVHPPDDIWVWRSTVQWYLQGVNRRSRRKPCPSATLSTTNPTFIDSGANQELRFERPATNCRSHARPRGVAPTRSWPRHYVGWVVSITPWLRFTPGKGPLRTRWKRGWVGLRAGLDTEAGGKIWCLCQGSNPGRPVVKSVVR